MTDNYLVTVSKRVYADLHVHAMDARQAAGFAEEIITWDEVSSDEYTVEDDWVIERVELVNEQLELFEVPT